MPIRILIIDDDPCVLETLGEMLELEGFTTQAFPSTEGVVAALHADPAAIVLSDLRLPGQDGLALLAELQALDPELPVLLMSGHGDIPLATQAMREGAVDFLEKPVAPETLIERLRQAQRHRQWALAHRDAAPQGDAEARLARHLLGDSPAMVKLREQLLVLANADIDTLVYGETGSGKDVLARALHEASPRRDQRFMAINCGAMPESLIESELFGHEAGAFTGASQRRIGKLEAAQGGTLFLDEIESMPLTAQIRLLRVLQERCLERLGGTQPIPIDIRVVAASKADLQVLSDQGQFRHDLYYRLNVASLRLPPLRERGEDILLLFDYYCREAAERFGRPRPALGPAQRQQLLGHPWPGNVRELRNTADRFVLGLVGEGLNLSADAGHDATATTADHERRLEAFECELIRDALASHQGQVGRAAEVLRMSRKTLYRKMKKHGLDKAAFRDGKEPMSQP
ncbi:sigma-54-dependent transcriptional regulator [Bisbaumannia pacifica]|uniref:Sigma-54-dependent Fis family transcriptional regulator n=1 Tax=Bisbaumannia pacifica TaxID=77098 RepID=A0ABD4L535_9GAMM|nr:sigma-54 dependent transcriptional regulator [Halomonas pacifica]MBH8580566.1 sigma-54-dependent Fis family transcriptional regulator [Halomonas pacifica]